MATLYILKNQKGNFYIGSTKNLRRRIKHHQGGSTPSTRRLGKMTLIFSQEFTTIEKAREIERRLKKLKRKDYISKIIEDGFIKMGT